MVSSMVLRDHLDDDVSSNPLLHTLDAASSKALPLLPAKHPGTEEASIEAFSAHALAAVRALLLLLRELRASEEWRARATARANASMH